MKYSIKDLEKAFKDMEERRAASNINEAKRQRQFKLYTGEKGRDLFEKQILVSMLYKSDKFSKKDKKKIAKLILSDDKELNKLGKALYNKN